MQEIAGTVGSGSTPHGGGVTAREELGGYVALQRLLNRRSALQRERETPPEELAALRARFAERHDALEAKQARLETLSREQATLQGDAEVLREEREHFRRQKSQVTNMKQLTAVVSELDHVESELKAKEDRLLEIMQELEATAADIEKLSVESPEEKAVRESAEEGWNERRAASEGELKELEGRLRDAQRSLGAAAMTRFKKLWASRKPFAVVAIEGTACSSCHAELRPSLVQLVRTAEALQYCDSCRRLLFDPEQFPAS